MDGFTASQRALPCRGCGDSQQVTDSAFCNGSTSLCQLVPRNPAGSAGAGESQLTPAFVDENCHRIGEVHAAAVGLHRDPQPLLRWQTLDHLHRQPASLGAKQQHIPRAELAIGWIVLALGGTGKDPALR